MAAAERAGAPPPSSARNGESLELDSVGAEMPELVWSMEGED
jgi:hypothetical protein